MIKESLNHKKEEVLRVLHKTLEKTFTSNNYSIEDAQSWTSNISEEVTKALKTFDENFKYCVFCIVFQKGDSGMETSSCCLWDNNTDSSFVVVYENNQMHCIVNCFCLFKKV